MDVSNSEEEMMFAARMMGGLKGRLDGRLKGAARLRGLRRAAELSDRAVVLALLARCADEVLSGMLLVLTPAIRSAFDLSLVQAALLLQVLGWVALVVEPVANLLVDHRSRRALLTWGAAWVAVAAVLLGVAPVYAVAVGAFAAYGLGSGPLAFTAGVVLVESFPDDSERVFARATLVDTAGALVGPLLVAGALAVGASWRLPLLLAGAGAAAYAVSVGLTRWPAPPRQHGERLLAGVKASLAAVARSAAARRWLVFLFAFDVFEAPTALRYVWLHDHVGLSEGAVALYASAEQVAALVALVLLDRWLRRAAWSVVLTGSCVALVVLTPAWLYLPGTALKLAFGMVLAAASALPWPIAEARSLTSVPGCAGAVAAVTTLFPLVPVTLAVAIAGRALGLTAGLFVAMVAGSLAMLAASRLVARLEPAA
jgi:MFS family permease